MIQKNPLICAKKLDLMESCSLNNNLISIIKTLPGDNQSSYVCMPNFVGCGILLLLVPFRQVCFLPLIMICRHDIEVSIIIHSNNESLS
jgi:hypothetical protein